MNIWTHQNGGILVVSKVVYIYLHQLSRLITASSPNTFLQAARINCSIKLVPAFEHCGHPRPFNKAFPLEKLFEAIRNKSTIRIKSNTTIDSYGFCLSALLSNAEFANRVIVIKDSNTLSTILYLSDRLYSETMLYKKLLQEIAYRRRIRFNFSVVKD